MSKSRTSTTTTVETTIELSNRDLARLLTGYIESWGFSIEHIQRVFVKIPGGGDWSNTDLDIDLQCPLIIVFKKENKE